MNNILLFLLIAIALVMLFLGIKASMLPPALTGVGFLLIAAMLYKKG
jgi:small-conductance mechanosensitive channel